MFSSFGGSIRRFEMDGEIWEQWIDRDRSVCPQCYHFHDSRVWILQGAPTPMSLHEHRLLDRIRERGYALIAQRVGDPSIGIAMREP